MNGSHPEVLLKWRRLQTRQQWVHATEEREKPSHSTPVGTEREGGEKEREPVHGLNAFPILTMVTVVLTEPNDICVKEKGCGSMSGVILDTDAAAAFKWWLLWFQIIRMRSEIKQFASEAVVKKQSWVFPRDVPTQLEMTERDGEAGRLRWRQWSWNGATQRSTELLHNETFVPNVSCAIPKKARSKKGFYRPI